MLGLPLHVTSDSCGRYNKELREGIDNLRRERVVFDGINAKLSGELHEKKKEMAQIIEISNLAYEARDQALNEMSLMRAHADKEQVSFENEWRDLGRLLEQDKRLKEKALPGNAASKSFDDKDAKKSQVKNNWNLARDKASQKASIDRVQSFEEAFQQIKNATGIDNIDELVQTFIDAEDQNFSLFNYVNELNNEIEKLDESIAEVRLDIDKYKGQGGQSDKQRKKLLKDLEDRLAATEARAEQCSPPPPPLTPSRSFFNFFCFLCDGALLPQVRPQGSKVDAHCGALGTGYPEHLCQDWLRQERAERNVGQHGCDRDEHDAVPRRH